MRTRLLVLFFLLTAGVAEANGGPNGKTFGLGVQLGVPLGITGKAFFGDIPALAFGVGAILPFSGIGAWVDLDLHFLEIHNRREDVLKMYLYAGPGIQVGAAGPYYYATYRRPGPGPGVTYGYIDGGPSLAIRAPFGFTIHWQKVTFDTFVEVMPAVYLLPGVFVVPEGAVGARYYF